MECYSLLVLKQSPRSHSQCRPFLTNLLLSWCSPISFGLLIPQEFSHICPLLVNLTILKYPICFLGSQFSLAFVCSDLTDNSMNLIFLQQTKTFKVLCYRIQSSSSGGRRYCGYCRLKWFFSIIYILKYSERKQFKKSPARIYRLGTS